MFGKAYVAAFTPENNKKAFEKTGVHPFNRAVIKPKDLAPSIEHSKHATLLLTVLLCVQLFMDTFQVALSEKDGWETDDDGDGNNSHSGDGNDIDDIDDDDDDDEDDSQGG